uniref:Glucuronosyltransferase n=1 Tax=Meloidogyne hapla TaxID=6305 RepID=A0A1I8BPQ6_MELHA
MSPIFWFSTFFFLSIILKEFNVYCMWPWKYEKSETSEPLLGFRNDKGGSSSSVGGVNHSNQKQIKSHNGKRILFITETREPHYSFAYFIIVDYYNTNRLKKPVEVVLIEVPFPDMEYKNNFGSAESPEKSWTIKDDIEGAYLLRVLGFHMFSSYKAIIENPTVNVNDKKQKIFDWLKTCAKVKFFDLGIAEFSYMTGALFIFKEIGLKKYIATTSIAPFPAHLHFLGYKYNFSFPGK